MISFYPAVNYKEKECTQEERLVFNSLRRHGAQLVIDDARTDVGKKIDWQKVLYLADAYHTIPWLYKDLKDNPIVPAAVIAYLRQAGSLIFAKNTMLFREACEVIYKLSQRGIAVTGLKGIVLARDVYCDLGARRFDDVDILVARDDFAVVEEVLRDNGYTIYQPERVTFSLQYRSQVCFVKDDRYVIDVHWQLMDLERFNKVAKIDITEILHRKEKFVLDGVALWKLAPVDLIIYQCLHLAIQHAFKGLVWYLDIHKIINTYKNNLPWDEVVNQVQAYNVKRPVFYALCFTQRLFNTEIPPWVLMQINPGLPRWKEWIIFSGLEHTHMDKNVEYVITPFLLDTWKQKVEFVLVDSFRSYKYFIYSLAVVIKSVAILVRMMICRLNQQT